MITGGYRAVLRVGYLGAGRDKFVGRMDKLFGADNWTIGYLVDGKPISRDEALALYQKSYTNFLKSNPEFTERLLKEARDVYDTNTSNIESGFDWHHQEDTKSHLQDIAVRRAVRDLGREFTGAKLLQIRGQESDLPELNPGKVPFVLAECILRARQYVAPWIQFGSVEDFWQNNKFVFLKPSSNLLSRLRQQVEETLATKKASDWKLSSQSLAALIVCGGGDSELTTKFVGYVRELMHRPPKGNAGLIVPDEFLENWVTDILMEQSKFISACESSADEKIGIMKNLLPAIEYCEPPIICMSLDSRNIQYKAALVCALADGPFPLSRNCLELVRLYLMPSVLDALESDTTCRSAMADSALAKMGYSQIRAECLDRGVQREYLDEEYKQRFLKLCNAFPDDHNSP